MASIPFLNVEGKNVSEIEQNLSEKHPHWHKVTNDPFIRVYANLDEYPKQYKVILACDGHGIIRHVDMKSREKSGKFESFTMYRGIFSDYVHSYRDIKEYMCDKKEFFADLGISLPVCSQYDLKMAVRHAIRNHLKYHTDPLSVPIRNTSKEWRTVSVENDTCTDFIIIPDVWGDKFDSEDEQDQQEIWDDIEEFVYTTVGYRTGYDFPTGLMITMSYWFKRLPCGVAIVHRRGIDW